MPDDEDEEGEGQPVPLKPDGSVDFDEIERQYRLKFPPREVPAAEQAVIDELWRRKLQQTDFEAVERGDPVLPTHAYCTTTGVVEMSQWNGNHPPEKNTKHYPIAIGATLKIVMISRMGDFGLTDDLKADNGYGLRLPWDDARIINLRWEP